MARPLLPVVRLPWPALAAAVSLAACATPEFEVAVDFVVPVGHDSFAELDYLQLAVDYGDGRAWTFWREAPTSGAWDIPELPAGEVTFAFRGLVSDGLGGTGQIVVASGSAGPLPFTEGSEPLSVLFTRRGRMGTLPAALDASRLDPMLVTLPDGRLLALGGSRGLDEDAPIALDAVSALATDGLPGAYSFVALDRMRGPRVDGRALLVQGSGTEFDGQVFVFGVPSLIDRRSGAISTDLDADTLDELRDIGVPEIFDPATNSWSDGPDDGVLRQNAARGHHCLVQLGGQLMVVGGIVFDEVGGLGLSASGEVDLLDLASGDARAGAPLAENRWAHTCTVLADGRVLAVGGAQVPTTGVTYPETELVEVYDPVADSWSSLGNLVPGRADHVAIPLPDGRVLVAGGITALDTEALADSFFIDPEAETIVVGPRLSQARARASWTALADGRVLVCGGEDAALAAVPGCEVWALDAPGGLGAFAPAPDPADAFGARAGAAIAQLPGGEVVLVGGQGSDGGYRTDLLVYAP